MDNRQVAQRLIAYANYLDGREGNLYRIRAYRRAAETVLARERPLSEVIGAEGRAGLEGLPGIGSHLSYTVEQLVCTGEFRLLTGDEVGSRRP